MISNMAQWRGWSGSMSHNSPLHFPFVCSSFSILEAPQQPMDWRSTGTLHCWCTHVHIFIQKQKHPLLATAPAHDPTPSCGRSPLGSECAQAREPSLVWLHYSGPFWPSPVWVCQQLWSDHGVCVTITLHGILEQRRSCVLASDHSAKLVLKDLP